MNANQIKANGNLQSFVRKLQIHWWGSIVIFLGLSIVTIALETTNNNFKITDYAVAYAIDKIGYMKLSGSGSDIVIWGEPRTVHAFALKQPQINNFRIVQPEYWRSVTEEIPHKVNNKVFLLSKKTGWPCRMLKCEIVGSSYAACVDNRLLQTTAGLSFGQSQKNINASMLRIVPYGPIWTGLLINWIFCLGATKLIVLSCSFVVRQINRRRRSCRGCCAKCGYLLEGLIGERCPECGVSVIRVSP